MTDTQPDLHVLHGFPDTALRFFRALEQSRRRVASQHDLSEIELRALFRIGAEGMITPKVLSEELGLTKGAITGVSTRLVEAGHVRRVDHPRDRRSLQLALTETGHDAVGAMHVDFREMLSTAGTAVTEAELEGASEVLNALTVRILAGAEPRG